jgi:hypothetical protein
MNSTRSIGGTIPISLRHWSRYCTYSSSSSNYFGIFQLGWALTLLFLFSTLQWVVTYVTTRGIQLAVLVELSPFLWDIGAVIVRTGSSSSNYFGIFQLGWAPNPLFLFSMLQWVVTHVTTVDEFNSQYWWNYPTSLTHCAVRTGSSSSNYFWYLSTRMGPNPFVPFQHAPMGCNVRVTTRGWIQLAVLNGTSQTCSHVATVAFVHVEQTNLFTIKVFLLRLPTGFFLPWIRFTGASKWVGLLALPRSAIATGQSDTSRWAEDVVWTCTWL